MTSAKTRLYNASKGVFLALLGSAIAHAAVTVTFSTSVGSPQPVGTTINLSATASDSNPGPINYKFEVESAGSSAFAMLQDFDLTNTFAWVPSVTDGSYILRVTARDAKTGEVSSPSTLTFVITSNVSGSTPVVAPTNNPLVALFSAPPCPAGSFMRVQFEPTGGHQPSLTDFRPCLTTSMNFEIAGMIPSSSYKMVYQIETGQTIKPDTHSLIFKSGSIPGSVNVPRYKYPDPVSVATSIAERVNLFSTGAPVPSFATDLVGNTVWYNPSVTIDQLTRPVAGGTVLVLSEGCGTGVDVWGYQCGVKQQLLQELDLAGNVVRQTDADRISEQLPVSDVPYGIDRFSHEARKMPNGDYLVLAETQKVFPAGTQGSNGAVDILGAIILVLDPNFQVVWYWNAFDHDSGGTQLDINRAALQNEQCRMKGNGKNSPGCPDALLLPTANDWLHANALQLLGDGNILMSMRNQDWVAKIDYENGVGTGGVLWRLGKDGDFQFTGTSDPYPWFSGQHDPEFQNGLLAVMSVFDDGNVRTAANGGNSRGQVLNVDESSMIVSFILNADLGTRSDLLGSAQPLSNGDWAFDSGAIPIGQTGNNKAQTVEVNGNAVSTFNEQVVNSVYRSFRMTDFYNVPQT